MPFSNDIAAALREGRKIDAIKLLRKSRGIGLKEAKELVEQYQKDPAHLNSEVQKAASTTEKAHASALPQSVLQALKQGRKIEAIKLLRESEGDDLKSAKQKIDTYLKQVNTGRKVVGDVVEDRYAFEQGFGKIFIPALVIGAIVWAMINSIDMIASIIILSHHKGYQKQIFTIEKLIHNDDHESGLSWGFEGEVAGAAERFYAPALADAKVLKYQGLRRKFPVNTRLQVWYNNQVTGTLFQHRTLRVLPYTPDLVAAETRRIGWWLAYCLAPLVAVLIIAKKSERNTRH